MASTMVFLVRTWRHRALLQAFIGREIRSRYIGSIAGIFWALIHPLLLLGLYALIFSTIFKVALPELGERRFVEFVAVALWPWLAFQESVQRGLQAVVANAALVKKVAFPPELLVYGAVMGTFIVHMIGYLIVLALLAILGHGLHAIGIVGALVLLVLLLVLSLSIALPLAAMQTLARDTDQFMAPVFIVLFYTTPILYPLASVPEWLGRGMAWNPLLYFVQPIRDLLLTGHYALDWQTLVAWALVPVLFVIGYQFFLRLAPHFEDFL